MIMQSVNCDDVLTFGKHKGKTLKDVIDKNPYYIQWAIANNVITLNSDSMDYFYKTLAERNTYWYDDDICSEMDFAMGLSGGGQGW